MQRMSELYVGALALVSTVLLSIQIHVVPFLEEPYVCRWVLSLKLKFLHTENLRSLNEIHGIGYGIVSASNDEGAKVTSVKFEAKRLLF